MKKNFLCVIGLACMAVACNSVIDKPVQYGEISVSMGEPEVEVITKAPETLDKNSAEAAAYTVSIFEKGVAEAVYSKNYQEFQTQKLPLDKTYYVTAENCTEAAAEEADGGNGRMRLFGQSTDILLSLANISHTATVNCEVVNAKVSVSFDASTTGYFENLKVVLNRADPARVITVNQSADVTDVWFDAGSSVSYTITGTFKSGTYSKEVNMSSKSNLELEAKSHVKINVSVDLSNGQILIPTITCDTSLGAPSTEDNIFNPYE